MNELVSATVAVHTVVLVLGAVVAHLVYRAYRRTRSVMFELAAAGFGFLVLGLLFGGVTAQLLGVDALLVAFVQSVCFALGFGLLVYSFYVDVGDDDLLAV